MTQAETNLTHRSNHSEHVAELTGWIFERDAWGRLMVTDAAGRNLRNIEVIRGFPITDSNYGISLRDADGNEIAWIERLDHLAEPGQSLLREELTGREFVPVLQRIVRINGHTEPTEWEVETDRGPTRFVLSSEEDVRRLEGRRAMLVDSRGVRYLIPDLSALDSASRRILERYL